MVYGLEAMLSIEFEIPSMKLTIEILPHTSAKEEQFLYLTKLDETHRDATLINDRYQKCIKTQYDSLSDLTYSQKEIWS